MPQKLSQEIIDNVINKKNITKGIYFEIRDLDDIEVNSELYLKSIKNYSFNLSRKFQASTATLNMKNENGIFSPDNESAIIKRGYKVIIKEAFEDYPSTKFDRFYGIVKQINPIKRYSSNEVEIICYDSLVKLQETDIEKIFESSDKEFIENNLLTPNILPAPRDYLSQVYDGDYPAWANLPPPSIQIYQKGTSDIAQVNTDGFEVLYQSGQVILNQVININDFDVKSTYYYYKKGLLAEDIIKGILLEPDSFGNDIFTLSEITSNLSHEDNVVIDNLTPILNPLNLNTVLAVKKEITDTEIYIYRYDSWKFITNYKFKINDIEFEYNGKTDVIVGGIEMTKLLNIIGTHTETIVRGTKIELLYDVGENLITRAWRTTYNNITDVIVSGDFTILGANFETFDIRYGILLLDTQIPYNSILTLNIDYNFITLQSTGIEIPYLRLSRSKNTNRFEAIQKEILTLLPPNYVLFTQGSSKIWGKYLSQKPNGSEDFQLKLNKQIQYITDQDVYSRVFLLGKNDNPKNIMLDDDTKILNVNEYGINFNSYATDQPLRIPERINYNKDYYPFSIYRMRGENNIYDTDSMLIYPSWIEDNKTVVPIIKIDGVVLGNDIIRKSRMPVTLEAQTKTEWGFDCIIKALPKDVLVNYHVKVAHKTIIPPVNNDTSIVFYDVNGNLMNALGGELIITKANTDDMDIHTFQLIHVNPTYPSGIRLCNVYLSYDHSYFYDWRLDKDIVKNIGFISYSIIVPSKINGKPACYLSGQYFYFHRDIIAFQLFPKLEQVPEGIDYSITGLPSPGGGGIYTLGIYSKITASFRYRSILARLDEPQNLKDGDSATECQFLFFLGNAIAGQPLFVIDFQKNLKIQAFDIIAGKFYPHRVYDKGFAIDCEFSITLQSSNSIAFATLKADAGPSSTVIIVKEGQTDNFPSSGSAFLGDDFFLYTGKTSNSFTGVSGLSEEHKIINNDYTDPSGQKHDRGQYELILTDRFSNISSETSNMSLKSGDAISINKEQLGEAFECRMIRALVDQIEPVEYARRVIAYPVSLASFNVFTDIEFEANAKLTPTTILEAGFTTPPSTLIVKNTDLFATSGTAYLGTEQFSYTGKTQTSFTGVSGLLEGHFAGAYITKENVWLDDSLFVRDPNNFLKEIGDKVYKQRGISQNVISQELLNKRAKDMLTEFYKNHTRVKIENVFAPYAFVGQTSRLIDEYAPGFQINRNYFIEEITSNNGNYSLELAYYP